MNVYSGSDIPAFRRHVTFSLPGCRELGYPVFTSLEFPTTFSFWIEIVSLASNPKAGGQVTYVPQ
jgi:hypothetical protein